jgi:3-oxoacyl-[acyl-carrier-protein] synthase II
VIPVVISGIGHCSGVGLGVEALRRAWLDGYRATGKTEIVKTARGEVGVPVLRVPAMALPAGTVPESVERRMSRFAKMCFFTAAEALADAGTGGDPRRTGVIVGSAFSSLDFANAYQRRILQDGPSGASPTLFAASIHNSAAAQLSLAFGARGPNSTVSTMEQTAVGAARLAYDWIQNEVCDRVAVVLGDELSEYHLYYFAHFGDRRAAGEGTVTLIFERADLARKRYAGVGAPSLTSDVGGEIVHRAGGDENTHGTIYGRMLTGAAFEMALAALKVERANEAVTCVQLCRGLPPQSIRMS